MYRRSFVVLLAAATAMLMGCDLEAWGPASRYKEDFHHTYPLKSGGRLYLENFNGPVEISGWERETADISGTKYASTPEVRDALKIDIVTTGDSIRIRTVRPSGHRGNMGASFVIKVPRQTALERIESSNGSIHVDDIQGDARLRTSNGKVEVARLRGALEARTSNGSVELQDVEGPAVLHTSNSAIRAQDVRGAFEATTSNGSIRASLSDVERRRPLKLVTSNGSIDLTVDGLRDNEIEAKTSNSPITLRLPASIAANVKAHTSSSSITSDFDVTSKGRSSKNRLEGTIGGGGPLLDLVTSNGSIKLLKL
jgi:hypothetical protein